MPQSRDSIASRLHRHAHELRALGVEGVYLFGSVARGDSRASSDVDVFFDRKTPMGWEVVDIYEKLAALIGGEVDLIDRRALHPRLKDRIEAEAVRVF
jgi:predicted nucleotidyltransferase